MTAIENKPAQQDKPVWHPKVQALYRAALYWGLGKRSAWELSNAVHYGTPATTLDATAALDYIPEDTLDHIQKPFVNEAALVRAAKEQVPHLFAIGGRDSEVLNHSNPQQEAVQIFRLLEELYSYGLRRRRTKDGGWKFYIKE